MEERLGWRFRSLPLLEQALTHPSARADCGFDYNRLEYFGDSILKHTTEMQVLAQHVTWPEAYLTVERDRIVRNSNLAKAAVAAGLDKYILTKMFTGTKWWPTYTSELLAQQVQTRLVSTKTLADVVEALI